MKNEKKYDDIINLPHPTSQKHPRMAMIDRAAQFSPFAVLTGHGAAIDETARLTDERIDIEENKKEMINEKLLFIAESCSEPPEVTVIFFVPDGRKSGGEYVSVTGRVEKIDIYKRDIVMSDGRNIPIENVFDIHFKNNVDTV